MVLFLLIPTLWMLRGIVEPEPCPYHLIIFSILFSNLSLWCPRFDGSIHVFDTQRFLWRPHHRTSSGFLDKSQVRFWPISTASLWSLLPQFGQGQRRSVGVKSPSITICNNGQSAYWFRDNPVISIIPNCLMGFLDWAQETIVKVVSPGSSFRINFSKSNFQMAGFYEHRGNYWCSIIQNSDHPLYPGDRSGSLTVSNRWRSGNHCRDYHALSLMISIVNCLVSIVFPNLTIKDCCDFIESSI